MQIVPVARSSDSFLGVMTTDISALFSLTSPNKEIETNNGPFAAILVTTPKRR